MPIEDPLDMDWNKFLHQAIAGKDAALVREALAQGTDPNHPNAPDGPFAGATELYWALSGSMIVPPPLLTPLPTSLPTPLEQRQWVMCRQGPDLPSEDH